MNSVCLVVQNVYDIDARVQRKAEALVSAGYSVDVLGLAGAGGKKNYKINNVEIHALSLGKKRGSLARYIYEYTAFFLWVFFRMFLLARRRRYSVIDVNTLPDFLIFAAAPGRWLGAKLVLDMHEITPEFYMTKYGVGADAWLTRFLKYLERISFNFADYVVTINEPIRDLLIGRGLHPSKVIVVMNSADEGRFAAKTDVSSMDRNSAGFNMIYHGTLTQFYGLEIAIEAFHIAHQEMPGAELWILGSGTEKDALESLVLRLGLGSKIKLVGQVAPSEIPSWLRNSHVGVLPIHNHGFLEFAFPNKLAEFIIMDKPVLMSRLRTVRHYFSEEALCYFEPDNPTDLAKQMLRLYRDGDLRERLAARAKEQYAPIRWDVMKQRYLKLIEELAGSAMTLPQQKRAAESVSRPIQIEESQPQ